MQERTAETIYPTSRRKLETHKQRMQKELVEDVPCDQREQYPCQQAYPWRNVILSLSLKSHGFSTVHQRGVGPCEISLICAAMLTVIIIMQVVFREPFAEISGVQLPRKV